MKKQTKIKPPKKPITIDKEKIRQNIKFFINRRYDFVLVLVAIAYFNISSSFSDTVDLLNQKDKQIMDSAQRTTYITDSGVIKQYEKEKFDVYNQRDNVAKVLSDHLVNSAFVLTDKYKTKVYSSEAELYNKNKELQLFYKAFVEVNPRIATQKNLDEFEKAQKDWKQILRWFTSAINENNLPHTLDKKISDIEYSSWLTDNNYFTILIKIPVYAKSINNKNIEDAGLATAIISATGYYDLQQKSVPNPYGMKFTSFSLTHPTINHAKMVKENKE